MPDTLYSFARGLYTYKIRIMGAIIVVELCCLLLVLLWPVPSDDQSENISFSKDDEVTELQAPVVTRQQSAPPPPPAPQVPIPVPNDEPIEPKDIKFPKNIASDSIDSLSVTAGKEGTGNDDIAGNPEIAPRIIRIEEPTFENKTPYKADIYVRFLVNKKGEVEVATIQKITIYDQAGDPTKNVQALDNYVKDRTIKAALNWKFHPARKNGRPVRAYTTQIFTIDY